MNKPSEKCQVCSAEGFVFMKTTDYGYEVWGCKNGHSQMVKPKMQPVNPFSYWYGYP